MIRKGLKLDPKKLPRAAMWGLWKVIDENANGFICAGEFGRFMRLAPENLGPKAIEMGSTNSQMMDKIRENQAHALMKREETWARQTASSASAAALQMEAEAERLEALLKGGDIGMIISRSSASLARAGGRADVAESPVRGSPGVVGSPDSVASPAHRMAVIKSLTRETQGSRQRVQTNGSPSMPLLRSFAREEGQI